MAVGSSRLAAKLFLLCFMSASGAVSAADAIFSVHAVKAAYLHRFASYVEWPERMAGMDSFVIAVAGDGEVAKQLARLLPGMSVRGRPAVLRRVSQPAELEGVHILYVGRHALSRTRALRAAATRLPILVVTDAEHGFDAGGIINFLEVDRNVRLEISLNAADRSGLRIDSALLSVAARVERRPQTRADCPEPRFMRSGNSTCALRMARIDAGRAL
jgi:hypothetical protein